MLVLLLSTVFEKTSSVPFPPFACCKLHLTQGSSLVDSPKILDASRLTVCCLVEDWGSCAMGRGSSTGFLF